MDILVVTSTPDLARLLQQGMEADGHTVSCAPTGAAASRAFLRGMPDVALVDTRLPDVSGESVLKELRRCSGGQDVSVVVLADDRTRTRRSVESLNAEEVLEKPVSLLDLSDLVRNIAAKRPDRPASVVAAPQRPEPAAPRAPRRAPPVSGLPRAPPRPPPGGVAETVQALAMLRREARVLASADAWTVLGIPAGSGHEVVARAAERMRTRYRQLGQNSHVEIQSLAREVLRRIEDARCALSEVADDDENAEGRALIDAGRWTAADAWFSSARDRDPGSALLLAHLGWARFHNPAFSREDREEDGIALIELAEQFDPRLELAQVYLGRLAMRRGQTASARAYAVRALRLAPQSVDARALLESLPREG